MKKALLGIALGGLAFLGLPSVGSASTIGTPLLPGGGISNTDAPFVIPTTTLAGLGSVIDSNSGKWNTLGDSGHYAEDVIQESGGTLDFAISVSNNLSSLSNLKVVSTAPFNGFSTNILFDAGDGALGGVLPLDISRDASGFTVSFNYFSGTPPVGIIPPGSGTPWLIVQTNATSYVAENMNIAVQDGLSTNVAGFAPASVPLPSAGWGCLALFGMVVGGQYARRRNSIA